MNKNKLIFGLFFIIFFSLLYQFIPGVFSGLLVNLSLTSLLKAPGCDPDWFACKNYSQSYPLLKSELNEKSLNLARDLLTKAKRLNPSSEVIPLHLASVFFSLEDRQTSAIMLSEVQNLPQSRSPLLHEDRYEARLVKANLSVLNNLWESSIQDYRTGLAWGDERVLPEDQRDYFLALSNIYQDKARKDTEDVNAIYLSGKFLAEAGEWELSMEWFTKDRYFERLPIQLEARRMEYFGRWEELQGNTDQAIKRYEISINLNPNLRTPYIRIIRLLTEIGDTLKAQEFSEKLINIGMEYPIGEEGEGYVQPNPAELDNGWILHGYDLDEELLEDSHFLTIFLWWKCDGVQPVGNEWIRAGAYWIQEQIVVNLFANAGFEWGIDKRGIPVGQEREIYGNSVGNLLIEETTYNDRHSKVLVTNNNEMVRSIALASRWLPVDSEGFYLMTGWIFDEFGMAALGRSCKGIRFSGNSPFYINQYLRERPLKTWIHHAQLSHPHPGFIPEFCEILLMNDAGANLPSYWDNILFAHIKIPE